MDKAFDGRRLIGLLAFFLIVCATLLAVSPVATGLSQLGVAIVLVALSPAAIHAVWPAGRAVPFFPAIGIFYACFFGLPLFAIKFAWLDASSIVLYSRAAVGEIQIWIVALVLAGVTMLVAGFYAGSWLVRRLPPLRFPDFVNETNLAPVYAAMLIVHQAERIFPGWSGITSLVQLSEPFGYVGLGGFFLQWRRGGLSMPWLLLCTGVFLPVELYLRVRMLYLSDILLLLIFVVFVFWRELLFKWAAAGLAISVVIVSLYGATVVVRYSAPEGLGRISLALQAYVAQFVQGAGTLESDTQDGHYEFWGRLGSLTMRTGHLWVFHIVATRSPDPVPYWHGETYRPLLTSAIPRVLYPSKPVERAGLEFGRRYGFLTPDQTATSVNISWLVELLANFGPLGVMLGMPIFGIFLATLDRLLNCRDQLDVEFLVGLTLIAPLVYPESNFSVMTGSLISVFIALSALLIGGAYFLRAAGQRFGWA